VLFRLSDKVVQILRLQRCYINSGQRQRCLAAALAANDAIFFKKHKNMEDIFQEGYTQALKLLKECATKDGFLASPTDKENYRRIWGRDGTIIGLAALMTGEPELIQTTRATLLTLARHQGPHGEIPSNVDTASGRVSYGGMAGRVDANLWFIIGCGEYWRATEDHKFISKMLPVLEKVFFLLGAWEYNNRGLLYVPETGDWADEYIHSGYVLFDQLLYLQAMRTYLAVHPSLEKNKKNTLEEKTGRLLQLIRANFWLGHEELDPTDIYHRILHEKGQKAATRCASHFWVPFFTPHGYGYRFDAFSNVLVSLFGIADKEQRTNVERYIRMVIMTEGEQLLPAFCPVIKPMDKDWQDLHMTFSYTFKNEPYEYHNGGLWPMISGFYVAELVQNNDLDKARAHLGKIHEANNLRMDGHEWSFPEYVHGRTFIPEGTKRQGWSGAAAIIGTCALEGKQLFRIGKYNA
jgi:glycogen debranching enzyme